MKNQIVELYDPVRLARLEKRCAVLRRILLGLALAALAVCIVLTTRVNNRNLYQMLLACICISVGTAWIILYLGTFVVRDGKREIEHAANLAEGPRECVAGRVTVLKLKVRIRNSITLRKLRVDTAEGPVNLSVHIDKAERLCRAGEWLKLYTVHGYVVAYEVMEHADT